MRKSLLFSEKTRGIWVQVDPRMRLRVSRWIFFRVCTFFHEIGNKRQRNTTDRQNMSEYLDQLNVLLTQENTSYSISDYLSAESSRNSSSFWTRSARKKNAAIASRKRWREKTGEWVAQGKSLLDILHESFHFNLSSHMPFFQLPIFSISTLKL